jgi:hypothetical protein
MPARRVVWSDILAAQAMPSDAFDLAGIAGARARSAENVRALRDEL